MTFEEAIEKLKNIKDKLEGKEITLDESIKLYAESVEYTKFCMEELKNTEGKIVAIKSDVDGMFEKPLDVSEE